MFVSRYCHKFLIATVKTLAFLSTFLLASFLYMNSVLRKIYYEILDDYATKNLAINGVSYILGIHPHERKKHINCVETYM